MSATYSYLVIVIALFGFWFIVVRPARRSQQRLVDIQETLVVGDDVIISAGIFGTVRALDDGKVSLEIAPNTVITVARQAVVNKVPDEAPEEPTGSSDQD